MPLTCVGCKALTVLSFTATAAVACSGTAQFMVINKSGSWNTRTRMTSEIIYFSLKTIVFFSVVEYICLMKALSGAQSGRKKENKAKRKDRKKRKNVGAIVV